MLSKTYYYFILFIIFIIVQFIATDDSQISGFQNLIIIRVVHNQDFTHIYTYRFNKTVSNLKYIKFKIKLKNINITNQKKLHVIKVQYKILHIAIIILQIPFKFTK